MVIGIRLLSAYANIIMMTTQAYADRDISGALKKEIFCNYGRYKVFNFFYGLLTENGYYDHDMDALL